MKRNMIQKSAIVLGLSGVAICAAIAIAPQSAKKNKPIRETAAGARIQAPTPVRKEGGRIIYVSPTGEYYGEGTQEKPYSAGRVLNKSEEVLKAGDTVYFEPGDYTMVNATRVYASGTHDNYITFMKDPTKEGKVTLSFYDLPFSSLNRGVQLDGSYLYWYQIDVRGAGDNGLYIGGSYNVVEDCEFYDNRDSGLQLGRSNGELNRIDQWPSYNLIKNCTSYNNYDNETYGENADGFAAKLTVGYGNIFDGCIAYRNSDDGWDLYAKADSGTIGSVTIYNCVAFDNGMIAEPQSTFNAKFSKYDPIYNEDNTDSLLTRDGDGNGFKLGGSVMEGEVELKNCLAFNNRMHGVTDNSNPGVISVDGVTSYNNGATVEIDPTSAEYGNIKYAAAGDTFGNIDLARQTYSYNNIRNVLSINNGSTALTADAYRGSAADSILVKDASNSMKIEEAIDADSRLSNKAGTKIASPTASSTFAALPSASLGKKTTLHSELRNSDKSVNMGDILKINDRGAFISGKEIGADLSKATWGDYAHPDYSFLNEAASSEEAVLVAAKEILYIPTDAKNTYQNFNAITDINGVKVEWSSSSDALVVGTDVETTVSKATRVNIRVNRPTDADTTATLTATLTYGGKSATKTFDVVVKKDIPSIGAIQVEGVVDGRMIVDQYALVNEPAVVVANGSYNDARPLDASQYTLTREYTYQPDGNSRAVAVKGITTSRAGIFTVKVTASLASGDKATSTYKVYVASTRAEVDFMKNADGVSSEVLTVSKDGFIISGPLTNPTGSLRVLTKESGADAPTSEEILANGESYDFRDTVISAKVAHDNSAGYDVYYVLTNASGAVTSTIRKVEVKTNDIATKAELEAVLATNDSHTIYRLTADIDCEGSLKTSTNNWVGLFNGMGHTIKNVTLTGKGTVGIFPNVKGGTIENVNFSNISITDSGQKTGIIAQMYGGYVDNVGLYDSTINSAQRCGFIGQLISQTDDGLTVAEISRVKVENTSILSTRAGGIIGFIQASSSSNYSIVSIKDCYVDANIGDQITKWEYNGGIVGRNDDRNAKDSLEIRNCVFAGTIKANKYCGGILGGETGTGKTRISRCVSIGKLYYAMESAEVMTAQKNCSPIIGYYAGNADCIVSQCYGMFEEYNTNYGVTALEQDMMTDEYIYFTYLGFNQNYWSMSATAGHIVLSVN